MRPTASLNSTTPGRAVGTKLAPGDAMRCSRLCGFSLLLLACANRSAPGNPGNGPDGGLPLRPSPIASENSRPGSRGWQLTRYSRNIAAYAGQHSVLPGDQVEIHAAANAATSAKWELWRFGYYGGNRGRKIAEGGPVNLPAWDPPVLDPALGSVSANWPVIFAIPIPHDAVTGIYLAKLSSPLGETLVQVVVREPTKGAVILYPVSTNTYQAYNDWGGTSLYVNHRSDWGPRHAYAVSFDRPYGRGNGAGELFSKDAGFVVFAEGQGYDIAYVTDADLDDDPSLVDGRRMLAFAGHSEYWTANMRQAADHAIARGTHVAFFAANNAYWQVRFNSPGRRLLIGYKEFASLDPANTLDQAHVTTRWRDPPLRQPENALIGEMFGAWVWSASPLRVSDPSSWLWTGAGVQSDSIIVGVYNDEVDRQFDNGLAPSGVGTVADALVEGHNGQFSLAETTLYTAPSGAEVFSAGSISWSNSVGVSGQWDPRIQQLVANIFSRFAGMGTLGPAALKSLDLGAGPGAPTYTARAVQVSTISTNLVRPAAVAIAPNGDAIVCDEDRIVAVQPNGNVIGLAGDGPGYADGAASVARFSAPRGLAVSAKGDIYVSDSGNHRIRLISGGTVTTLAGSQQGFRDGTGSQALFSQPMGIALASGGTLLVADSWNHRIRSVSPSGVVSTWAGSGAADIRDGPGSTAAIQFPIALAVLSSGDVAVVEPGTGVIRKISAATTHDVTSFAGTVGGDGWTDGPVAAATVSETLAIAARPTGELVFVDGATARIRWLHNGVVETVAGGQRGGTVDGAGDAAGFGWVRNLAVAPDGSILVVDAREHALRRITVN